MVFHYFHNFSQFGIRPIRENRKTLTLSKHNKNGQRSRERPSKIWTTTRMVLFVFVVIVVNQL